MQKNHKKGLPQLGLSGILLLMVALLFVGVAWGRFRSEIQNDQKYTPRVPDQVFLWGEKTAEGFDSLPDTWKVEGGTYEVPFTVTNGIYGAEGQEDLYPSKDMDIFLRIAVTEGIGNAENLSVQLRLKDETGTFYQAAAQKIDENSPLYDEFGDGWVYTFRNNEGNEPRFTLRGGEVSCLEATLVYTVTPDTIGYSMMQLQVVAEG